MSDQKPKLVVGRVVELDSGKRGVAPLGPSHSEVALEYQRHLAALIAAAYLYKDLHTVESIERLKRAAEAM